MLRDNVALTNTDDGIDVERAGTKLTGNRADNNDDLGIEAVPGVRGSGNTATGNGNPLQLRGDRLRLTHASARGRTAPPLR